MNKNFTKSLKSRQASALLSFILLFFLSLTLFTTQAQTGTPLRRPISPQQPMWLIHIDTWNYADPQKIIDLIPADVRPYVVMNISISINHDATTGRWLQAEYGYETIKSWLRTCAENRMWAMVQQSSGGFQHFSDFDLRVYEELYRDYPNLLGFNYAEQFWGYDDQYSVTWLQRMAHFTNLLKLSNRYGGYLTVSWCGNEWSPSINPMAMMKRNPNFVAAAKQFSKNFILCEKYTQESYQSDMESLTFGAFLSGFSGNYGIRYDDTGWTDATGTHANFTMATAGAPHLEHIMLTGQTVVDGPELIWTQQTRELSAGPTSDGYVERRWELFPQFHNVVLDIFRKVLDGTVRIPTRKEVIDRTKVAIIHDVNSGTNDDIYSTPANLFEGLYRMDNDGNLKNNKSFFKKTGRYPTIPTVFQLADADANSIQLKVNASSLSSRWPTIAAKVNELNTIFPKEYDGDIYAGRHENGWVVYNPFKTGQIASGRIPFKYNTSESIELSFSQYTSGVIKETSDRLNIYLNNYDNQLNTGLKTDVIKIYGSTAEPTYTFADRGNHQASVLTKTWENGVFTLTVQHNGPLDISVNCSGTATGRLTSYKTDPVVRPELPAAYSGPRQYEAENFEYKSISGNVTSGVNGNIRNYTAQGYLRFGTNAAASIRKTITALLPGSYQLETKYSASAGDVNSVDLYVNGVKVGTPVFTKTANDSEWRVNTQTITLRAGQNTIAFLANRAGTYAINFDNIVVSGSIGTKYDFNRDVAGTTAGNPPARMVNLRAGTAGVVSYTDASNTSSNAFKAYSGGAKNGTGVADLELFPGTSDYSVTWKEYAADGGAKKGVLLRASGLNGSCPYANGMKQGYLFVSSRNTDGTLTLQSYIASTAGISPQESFTSSFSVSANTATYFRATAMGNTLKFECSRDSITWEGASETSFTDNSYAGGTTQLLWGFGSPNFNWVIDNITFQASRLSVSKLALSDFDYTQDTGPSASQVIAVSGRSLSNSATVTAPAGYEVSLNSSAGYGPSLNLPLTADSIPATDVYVRLKAGLIGNSYKGNLTISSGETTLPVALAGRVKTTLIKQYTFSNDAATTSASTPPATHITVGTGNGATAGVASFTDATGKTSNYLRPYSGGVRNATGALNLNLFENAEDYSVIWKQANGSGSAEYKVGMLLRANNPEGTASTGYVEGLKQGYLFIVYNNGAANPARSEFRIYKSSAATSLNMLTNVGVNTLAPTAGQPVWYRASVTGTTNPSLKFEYSTDSLTWNIGATSSDPAASFASGSTQFVWGLAAANWDSHVDNLTQVVVPRPGVVSVSETTLAGFNYTKGSGPSASRSFTVSANTVTENIEITAPANFEVSRDQGGSYGQSLTLTASGGTIAATTIYTRLKAGLDAKEYSGELSIMYTPSGGSTDHSIALSGKVSQPAISLATTSLMDDLGYISGYPSVERTITVSGTALSENLLITAPANFEISLNSGSGYASTLSLAPTNGSVSETLVYVRLKSGLNGATYAGTVTLSSAGATGKSADLKAAVAQQAVLTVSDATLSGFSYNYHTDTAPVKSFTVGGGPLAGDVSISAPANFEISLDAASGYGPSLVLPQNNSVLDPTTIYVRLKAALPENTYSGDITISSATASNKLIAVSGVVSWSRVYTFSNDVASTSAAVGNSPAQNMTIGAGNTATAGVVSYTDASQATSNRFRAYSGGQRNGTGIVDLNLFPATARDYSVTWKQSIGSGTTDYKVGVLLRGSAPVGSATTGYVEGTMNGYVFIVYNASSSRSEFRIYRSTSETSLNMLVNNGVPAFVPAPGQSVWYRVSASGSSTVNLKFEYSTDSLTWNIGAQATDASAATFTSGATQLIWGLASPGFDFYMDNITFSESNTFYVDADNDGYGSTTAVTLQASSPPSGYASNNTDCNDADASVHEQKQYYADNDGDGYGTGAAVLLCSASAPQGYAANNTDCDDTNAAEHEGKQYYVDADGDGYGTGPAVTLCASSTPQGYSTNNTDCNDADATQHEQKQYYVDSDNDGFGSTTTVMLCAATAPEGYATNNTDCNDADAAIHEPRQYYVDADNDGFGSGTAVMLCSLVAPAGYSTNNTDCDDTRLLYADNDGDGLGTGDPVACGVTNNTDCDDNNAVALSAGIADVFALSSPGIEKNTLYGGYGPSKLTLSASGQGGTSPYTYLWGNGQTSANIEASAPGTYTVTITDSKGCESSAEITINLIDVTCGNNNDKVIVCHNGKSICINAEDVDDHLSHGDKLGVCNPGDTNVSEPGVESVIVYPNPVTDNLSVQLSEFQKGAKVEIFNPAGVRMMTKNLDKTNNTISVSALAQGLYYVKVINGDTVTTKAIFKQ